jgi:hypothetical protein
MGKTKTVEKETKQQNRKLEEQNKHDKTKC